MKYSKDAKYYLQNGQEGESYSVSLLVNGHPKRDFSDISLLDNETLKIDNSKKSEILKPYNSKIDLTGDYFVAVYPFKKNEVDIHPAIFDSNNYKAQYFLNRLKFFAEQRVRIYEKYGKVKHLENSKVLEDYIYRLLGDIMRKCSVRLSSRNSSVPYKIKEYLNEKNDKYPNVTPENYINGRINVITNICSSYTELRKITYEYLKYLENDNTQTRLMMKDFKDMKHHNLYPMPIFDVEDEEIEQLSFFKTKKLGK